MCISLKPDPVEIPPKSEARVHAAWALGLLLACISFCAPAVAQCLNTIQPSCGVYATCFESRCNCVGSEDEYLVGFGKNYCEAFLARTDFSPQGGVWRDRTLRCLQEAIVPMIPFHPDEACNCAAIKSFAYRSHVDCYTQLGSSVCDLPVSDIATIAKTVVFDRAFLAAMKDYKEGYSQVKGVFEKCAASAQNDDARKKWAFYLKLLTGKIE
jgi:hypothetical protein